MNLEQVLQEWPNYKPRLIKSLGGLSNQSYLVETESGKFVVRLNRASENLGVSRDRERKILEKIKHLSFAPDICFWAPDYLVTKYIKSTTTAHPSSKVIADLFHQIHHFEYSDQVNLNPITQLSHYYQQIDVRNPRLKECYDILIHDHSGYVPDRLCLCHHDLLPGNIIQSKAQSKPHFTVIDWEYAQYGDPVFDLAIYAESLDLNSTQTDLFIGFYNGEVDAMLLHRYRLIYGLINLLWWKIKEPRKDISAELIKLESRIKLRT